METKTKVLIGVGIGVAALVVVGFVGHKKGWFKKAEKPKDEKPKPLTDKDSLKVMSYKQYLEEAKKKGVEKPLTEKLFNEVMTS
jgi:hypothetical protein